MTLKWKRPKIKHGKFTKWNWIVLYPENLVLGERVDIGTLCFLNAKAGIEIGDDVQLGNFVSVNSISTIDGKEGKIIIGKGAKIGMHSMIMPGVWIGPGAIIGAGSFVNRNIAEGKRAWGIPCREKKHIKT